MSEQRTNDLTLPTVWQITDDLWKLIASPLNQYDPPKATGRKRIDARAALDASGTNYRTLSPMTARFIAPSNGGYVLVSLTGSGQS